MTQASVGFHCPECTRSGAQKVVRAQDIGTERPPVIVALIAINVLAFFVKGVIIDGTSLTNWGVLYGPLVGEGEWWRIVTSGFLHASVLHIAFNMYALWIFGRPLEQALGSVRFAIAYAGGLLGGAVAVLLFDFAAPTLGASGAVLGLAGALAAVLWSRGIAITQTSLGGIFIMNLALPLLIPQISFWGHFGGIVGGFAVGWVLSWLPQRYNQSVGSAIAAGGGLCVVFLALALATPTLTGN